MTARASWLRQARGELAAEAILDAAGEVWRRHGVAAMGMGDIAAAAGCSRATIYRYFEDRHALQLAFVHRESRRIWAEIGAELSGMEDPEQRVVHGVLAAVDRVRRTPTLQAWFAPGDASMSSQLANHSPVIEGLVAAFLAGSRQPDDEHHRRARWLVRVILSFLAVPGADREDEQLLLARFVAPVVTGAPGRKRVPRASTAHG